MDRIGLRLEMVCSLCPKNVLSKFHAGVIRALLDVLERLPAYVTWIFTTTKVGQQSFFDDDVTGDAAPLVSRCVEVCLADGPDTRKAFAQRAKAVAQAAGVDGLPNAAYERVVEACKGNLRAVLQRVESGRLRDDACEELRRQLRALPADGRHGSERAALQAELRALGE